MKAVFAGVSTVDKAINYLERVKREFGGETTFAFGDGSSVALVVTDEIEGSNEKLPKPGIQVRLDRVVNIGRRQ